MEDGKKGKTEGELKKKGKKGGGQMSLDVHMETDIDLGGLNPCLASTLTRKEPGSSQLLIKYLNNL